MVIFAKINTPPDQGLSDGILARMDSVAHVLSSIDGEIRQMGLRQSFLQDSLKLLDVAVQRQSLVVAKLDSQYRTLEAERQPLLRLLSRSILADLRLGRWAMLDALLGSDNLADFLARRSAMTRLKDTAKRRATATARGLFEIRAIEDQSLDQAKELNSRRLEIDSFLQKFALREVELATLREQAVIQRDLLVLQQASLEKSAVLSREQLKEQTTSLKQLAEIVEKRTVGLNGNGTFASLKGLLPWPIEGSLASRFGKKTHRKLETVTENPGIDLKADASRPVRAVAAGRVTNVSWLRGFGHICIVQHEGDHHTVYARLAEVLVKQDDVIDQETIVGYPGFDPERNSYGVHFELWVGKDKQDPLAWLAPAKK